MSYEIKESDWKLFRRFHPIAWERFCQQVIEEVNRATSNCTGDYHKRYLEIFDLLLERNEKLAEAFDDIRRSRAIILVTNIKESNLLTDEEFSQFSPETQEAVERLIEIRRM